MLEDSTALARFNAKLRRDRLKIAQAKEKHTIGEWRAILGRANGHCERCGSTCEKLEKDHIEPIYQGGSDSANNLRAVCRHCNRSRGPNA